MHNTEIAAINNDLKKTRKAIISIGCSFVEGQGAIDQDIYEQHDWSMLKTGVPMEPILTDAEKSKLVLSHKELRIDNNGNIDWTFMQHKNAFVNVLCKKYFNSEYTAINFGLRGKGNRASIKSLYFHPQIDWHNVDELIVIYVPSGPERFDFLSDELGNDNNEITKFHCMWPWHEDQQDSPRKTLWKGYGTGIHSEKSSMLEQISNVIELENWCKLKNARLIITPGFDKTYTQTDFKNIIRWNIVRDENQKIIKHVEHTSNMRIHNSNTEQTLDAIVDQWPWDKMFKPQDCPTFIDLCLKQEGLSNAGFWDFNGKGTLNHWITVCCHPSAKGHDLFARELHKFIIGA